MSMSQFFRVLILSGEVKVLSPEFLRDIQRQVRGAGRNINQIARLAHISGKVSKETLLQISAEQEKAGTNAGTAGIMAVLKIHVIRQRLDKRVAYVQNTQKTACSGFHSLHGIKDTLTSAVNCFVR